MNQQIIQGVRFHPDQMEEGAIYAISTHSNISHNYHFQSLLPSLWVKMVQANQHYYKPWLLLLILTQKVEQETTTSRHINPIQISIRQSH